MTILTAAPATGSSVAFLAFVVISLFILLIPVIIGAYVYSDARKRGMNAALWTLVAIFAPALVGLIVYLIVRTDNAQCPGCKTPVSESFTVCPRCGMSLRDRCPGCGFRAEPDWRVCPQCAAELPTEGRVSVPFEKRDKALGKVLLAVILVPVILLVLGVAAMLLFRSSGTSGSFGMMGTTSDVLKEDFAGNAAVQAWFAECDTKPDGVYVLNHAGGEDGSMDYLVYLKGYRITGLNTSHRSGGPMSKPYANADILAQTDEAGYGLFFIETRGFPPSELKMTLNDKQLTVESSDVDSTIRPSVTREEEKAAMAH